jgi:hypothetical protein
MTIIEWKNPPRSREDHIDWDSIADQLRANPGRWALVAPAYGKRDCRPATSRGLTVIARKAQPRGFDIYARHDA